MAFDIPWQDNYPIARQLWSSQSRIPGNELSLSSPTNRNLTVQFRDSVNAIVLASSELQSSPLIQIVSAVRGVVQVVVTGDAWGTLKQDASYTCEIVAYGVLRDSFSFDTSLPDPGVELVSGQEIYTSPRGIMKLVGVLPGAQVETSVDLSVGWVLNGLGYWTKTVSSDQQVYGLWINDQHAKQVDYPDLAVGCDRQWARVGDTLYYKGSEVLDDVTRPVLVETAFNYRTYQNLLTATKEIERKTTRRFAKYRYYRELHRGLYSARQVALDNSPVVVDQYFRLDCFSRTRTLVRRYTEEQISAKSYPGYAEGLLHVNGQSGVITLAQGFWDWSDWPGGLTLRGLGTFPSGDTAIEASYTAGYDTIPAEIMQACAYLASIEQIVYWQLAMSQGSQSMNIGCVSFSFANSSQYTDPWRKQADDIIDGYQNVAIEAF